MKKQRQHESSHGGSSGAPPLPDLRADHIPEDVLAQQDAEEHVIGLEYDPLAALTGVPEDLLVEVDAVDRGAADTALTPTDDEVVDVTHESFE